MNFSQEDCVMMVEWLLVVSPGVANYVELSNDLWQGGRYHPLIQERLLARARLQPVPREWWDEQEWQYYFVMGDRPSRPRIGRHEAVGCLQETKPDEKPLTKPEGLRKRAREE